MTVNGPAPIGASFNVPSLPAAKTPPALRETGSTSAPPVQSPKGVDPALWQMLTPDEQSFFANQSILGPLTYGPVQETSAADAPRGQRIDVRA